MKKIIAILWIALSCIGYSRANDGIKGMPIQGKLEPIKGRLRVITITGKYAYFKCEPPLNQVCVYVYKATDNIECGDFVLKTPIPFNPPNPALNYIGVPQADGKIVFYEQNEIRIDCADAEKNGISIYTDSPIQIP